MKNIEKTLKNLANSKKNRIFVKIVRATKKTLMKKLITILICSFLSTCAFSQVVKSVPPDVFYDMLMAVDSNDRQLIDIRTRHEFEEHRIEGAINIDIRFMASFREKLEHFDRRKPVFVYCLRSVRTEVLDEIFFDLGFENVIELEGGMIAWFKAHKPIYSSPH
jgi:rhodanese-related sulfurtransferase